MNIWKTSAVAAALLSGTTIFAQEQVVYDNVFFSDSSQFAVSSDALEVGDEVTMTLGMGTITRFQFEYFLNSGNGNETAAFSIRTMANGEPGDVIFTTQPFALGVSSTPLQVDMDLTGLGVDFTSPTILWSVRFGGLEGGEQAGLLFYNGPTVGSSINDFWISGSSGWVRGTIPEVSGNFGARITAVPEPGTVAMMIAGLGFLGFLGYRRRMA